MSQQHIEVQATTGATPAQVFSLLADGATWPQWSPIGSFELEQQGTSGPEGEGAIRAFRTNGVTSREQLLEVVAGKRLSYTLLSGLPVRDYHATVELEEAGGETLIEWRSTFEPAIPGTGWFFRRFLGRFLQQCVDGLARAARS